MNQKDQLIQALLNTAIDLSPYEPFTFSSGILSPIYCDNRKLLAYPQIRGAIVKQFIDHFLARPGCIDIVAGTATAGIAWAAWIAEKLHKPMVYVRQRAKSHGKCNQIEGDFEKGASVLLVEDLISTGNSALHAAETLRRAHLEVTEIVSIMHYGLDSANMNFAQKKLKVFSLINLNDILKFCQKRKDLNQAEISLIEKWQHDPINWSYPLASQ
jgi:orotate phosphoribosyltransferase